MINKTCTPRCLEIYEEVRKNKKYRYVIFNFAKEGIIDVEVVGPRDSDYQQFLEDLTRNGIGECRYGLFDMEYVHHCQYTNAKTKRENMVLLCWCPMEAKIKLKMRYMSHLGAFLEHLVGLKHHRTVNTLSDISRDVVETYFRAQDK